MTNIVVFELDQARLGAAALAAAARGQGVLINALGPAKLRLVTHLDVSEADCARAADVLAGLLGG